MTKQETTEWLGRELTANEDALFDFLVPKHRMRQDDKILIAYDWLECGVSFLDTPIPQEALNGVYGFVTDEEGNESPKVTGLTLRDFSLQITLSLDGTKALVLLGAQEFAVGRRDYVSADDLKEWLTYLEAFGFTEADLLNKQTVQAIRESPAYNVGE